MIEKFPQDLRETVLAVLEGEAKLSVAEPDLYNSYVVDADYATSISASSRTFVGAEAVKQASVNVAMDNGGERDRTLDWIAAEYEENMAYVVFKSTVEVYSKSREAWNPLAWIVTIIFRKVDGRWVIAHRQNTRTTK